jgi:hypothetical protein
MVTARGIALFGKRDAGSDYEWLRGRDAIPDRLFEACEQLARTSNESGIVLSLIAALGFRPLLVRTYRQGADSAQRPILALEVAAVESEVAAEDWVGLAWSAIQPAALESAGRSGTASLELPAANEPDSPLEPDLLDRVRLGIPVSVSSAVARSLLRRFPQRFLGVAFAPKLKSGSQIAWTPALAPFLAVNFLPPVLRSEEEEALRDLGARRPSSEEWQLLETPMAYLLPASKR